MTEDVHDKALHRFRLCLRAIYIWIFAWSFWCSCVKCYEAWCSQLKRDSPNLILPSCSVHFSLDKVPESLVAAKK